MACDAIFARNDGGIYLPLVAPVLLLLLLLLLLALLAALPVPRLE